MGNDMRSVKCCPHSPPYPKAFGVYVDAAAYSKVVTGEYRCLHSLFHSLIFTC